MEMKNYPYYPLLPEHLRMQPQHFYYMEMREVFPNYEYQRVD